jgi:hypothetical protein
MCTLLTDTPKVGYQPAAAAAAAGAADTINRCKADFYDQYRYLKPQSEEGAFTSALTGRSYAGSVEQARCSARPSTTPARSSR